ncbi:nnp-1 protein putative nuclear protein 1 nop52 [Anaeramoeba flamelloides]|uniref:Nnp-1 protein putative nuclear protein 1 nop52 n=1 Tax=Anaeramoeba flamelloides TaxID=1746091 RepID=A0AAV7YHV9_9EUKA|nr:nnp-1 protein putative nuclear protein 1 nop52 [Anaeramoeba flamelloides]
MSNLNNNKEKDDDDDDGNDDDDTNLKFFLFKCVSYKVPTTLLINSSNYLEEKNNIHDLFKVIKYLNKDFKKKKVFLKIQNIKLKTPRTSNKASIHNKKNIKIKRPKMSDETFNFNSQTKQNKTKHNNNKSFSTIYALNKQNKPERLIIQRCPYIKNLIGREQQNRYFEENKLNFQKINLKFEQTNFVDQQIYHFFTFGKAFFSCYCLGYNEEEIPANLYLSNESFLIKTENGNGTYRRFNNLENLKIEKSNENLRKFTLIIQFKNSNNKSKNNNYNNSDIESDNHKKKNINQNQNQNKIKIKNKNKNKNQNQNQNQNQNKNQNQNQKKNKNKNKNQKKNMEIYYFLTKTNQDLKIVSDLFSLFFKYPNRRIKTISNEIEITNTEKELLAITYRSIANGSIKFKCKIKNNVTQKYDNVKIEINFKEMIFNFHKKYKKISYNLSNTLFKYSKDKSNINDLEFFIEKETKFLTIHIIKFPSNTSLKLFCYILHHFNSTSTLKMFGIKNQNRINTPNNNNNNNDNDNKDNNKNINSNNNHSNKKNNNKQPKKKINFEKQHYYYSLFNKYIYSKTIENIHLLPILFNEFSSSKLINYNDNYLLSKNKLEHKLNTILNKAEIIFNPLNQKQNMKCILTNNSITFINKGNNNKIFSEMYTKNQKIFIHLYKENYLYFQSNNSCKNGAENNDNTITSTTNNFTIILRFKNNYKYNLFINCFYSLRKQYLDSNNNNNNMNGISINSKKIEFYSSKKNYRIKMEHQLQSIFSLKKIDTGNKSIKNGYKSYSIHVFDLLERKICLGKIKLFKKHFLIKFNNTLIIRKYSPYSFCYLFSNHSNEPLFVRFHIDENCFINISFLNNKLQSHFISQFQQYRNFTINQIIKPIENYNTIFTNTQTQESYKAKIFLKYNCLLIKTNLESLHCDYLSTLILKTVNNSMTLQIGNGFGNLQLHFNTNDDLVNFEKQYTEYRNIYISLSFDNKFTSFKAKLINENIYSNVLISNYILTFIKFADENYTKISFIERYYTKNIQIFNKNSPKNLLILKTQINSKSNNNNRNTLNKNTKTILIKLQFDSNLTFKQFIKVFSNNN